MLHFRLRCLFICTIQHRSYDTNLFVRKPIALSKLTLTSVSVITVLTLKSNGTVVYLISPSDSLQLWPLRSSYTANLINKQSKTHLNST